MVGRREECQKLLSLWERAKRSGAPFVVVTGRAGIGKSRLVEFLAETAAGNRANRLECICTEMLKPVAFAPLIGVLERFANIRQADSSEVRLAKLDSSFCELAPEFAEFVPYLAWMMSIPSPGRDIVELQPEVIRERIFDSLIKVLKLGASIRPSVFWIEDLQWADHSTQEFCQRLEAHGPMPGLLVVATMRIDYAGSRSPVPWSDVRPSTDSLVTVELGPLSADESRQLISGRSGLPADAPVAQTIVESTGGNPLYIEEVVRSVLAGRVTRQDTGTPESQLLVPESLQPIFAQLVDRLEGDRHIAQMASLLGRDLPEPLTRTVIARILGVSEDEVVGSLARLIEAEIVEPILTELSHGYRFRHDLIREALVHSVGPDAASNHGRIAKVIEQLFSDYARERPELLAYHFAKADLHERAAEYWLTAGIGLQARAAHQEAIASFDRGLESLSRVVQPTDDTANARLELSLRAGRGVSVQTTKGYTNEKAGTDWARAYALSKMIGAEGALVPALGGLWSFHFVRGANTFIRDLGATSVKVAEQILEAAGENPAGQVIGYACLAYAQYFHGELTEGRESAERSWEVYDKVKDRGLYLHVPQDPGLAGLSFLGPVRWSLGDQLGAARAVETATALGSALESKRAINLARIGQTNAWLHQIRRDYQQALSAADQALTVALEFHVDWAVVNLLLHKGLALAHLNAQGNGFADAVALVRQNLGYWRAGGAETMVPYFLGQLAEAHHLAGEHREALDLVDQAIALSETVDEHCHSAELYRVRGETRLVLFGSETRSGIDDLIHAAERARHQRAVSFEIRSIVSLLTAVPELLDRERWIGRLEDAIGDLASSENGQDERRGRALIAETRKNYRGRPSEEFR
jgi:predicted ATPase